MLQPQALVFSSPANAAAMSRLPEARAAMMLQTPSPAHATQNKSLTPSLPSSPNPERIHPQDAAIAEAASAGYHHIGAAAAYVTPNSDKPTINILQPRSKHASSSTSTTSVSNQAPAVNILQPRSKRQARQITPILVNSKLQAPEQTIHSKIQNNTDTQALTDVDSTADDTTKENLPGNPTTSSLPSNEPATIVHMPMVKRRRIAPTLMNE